MEAKESLLLVLRGGVLISGGVVFFLCCLCLVFDLGFVGRERSVRDPSGEDVLLVDVDDEEFFAGGLVTGS